MMLFPDENDAGRVLCALSKRIGGRCGDDFERGFFFADLDRTTGWIFT